MTTRWKVGIMISREGFGSPARRIVHSLCAVVGAVSLSTCSGTCSPSLGNLQVRANGSVRFTAAFGAQQTALDAAHLQSAPLASFRTSRVEVDYSDSRSTSTTDAQLAIVVMARDQTEQQATLQSIGAINGDTCGEDNTHWLNETSAPGDFPDQYRTVGGVSLPDALEIAYPIDLSNRATGSVTNLNPSQFSGNPTTPLALEASGDSVKSLYILQRGVCSTEVDLRSQILDAILQQLPDAVINGINDATPSPWAQGAPQIRALGMSTFLTQLGPATPGGGFDQYLAVHVPWQWPPLVNDAAIVRNYSYTFVLNNGVLATTGSQNHSADCDTGFFSGTVANGLDGHIRQQVSNGIYLAALGKQAVAITNPTDDPACKGNAATKPASCFVPCQQVPDDPKMWPKGPDNSNIDDSAWYDTSFCSTPANLTLTIGVEAGADQQAAIDPGFKAQLQQPGARDTLVQNLVGKRTDDPSKFKNIRCNFQPNYVTPDPNLFGGRPPPVCEFVVRAKRLNVLPDSVELIWFDAAAIDKIPASEFPVEGLSVFLLTLKAGGALCTRRPYMFTNGRARRFAHVSLY